MLVSKTIAVVNLVAGVDTLINLPQNNDVNATNVFSQPLNQVLELKIGNTTAPIYLKFIYLLNDTGALTTNYDAVMPVIPSSIVDSLHVAMKQGAVAISLFCAATVTGLIVNVGK